MTPYDPSSCGRCDSPFVPTRPGHKYCSPECCYESAPIATDEVYLRRLIGLTEKGDPGDCWPWKGAVDRGGYGKFRYQNRTRVAHRIAYQLMVGPIPKGLHIDHLCRNRGCVNPSHMEPVTKAENTLRGESPTARHARKTHCKHGHEFTEANTYIEAGRFRKCRTCRKRRRDEYNARKASRGLQ